MYISVKDTKINLNENGTIKAIYKEGIQLNLFKGNSFDTPVINVYLSDEGKRIPLISSDYLNNTVIYENGVKYEITYKDTAIEVNYILTENGLIDIKIKSAKEYEFTYTFDVGAGDEGFLDDKEAYASQYIDSKVFNLKDRFAIAMRRTLSQSTGYPQIEVMTKDKIDSYCTEGYDFYPLDYKRNFEVLSGSLPSRDKHYELAFFAIAFKPAKELTLTMHAIGNNEEAISDSIITDDLLTTTTLSNEIKSISFDENVSAFVNGDNVDVINTFGDVDLLEEENGEVFSFFTKESAHVVLPAKEYAVQRMHGNIITTGNSNDLSSDILVSSNYINGVFTSQNAIGNVGQNTLNSNIHSSLDIQKMYGQRMFINIDGNYKLLNAPSYYEMGLNYSKWFYKIGELELNIIVYTDVKDASLTFTVNANQNVDVVVMDSYRDMFEFDEMDQAINFYFKKDSYQANHMSDLSYIIEFAGGKLDTTNQKLAINEANMYSVEFEQTNNFTIQMSASKTAPTRFDVVDFDLSVSNYLKYINDITNNLSLELPGNDDVNMFNHLIKWYTHNALIHFATPHGLEQHAGSAWGTRDVCQGPLEFFLAFGKFDKARDVLLEIFKNQTLEDGTWPQWFMFDEYSQIRADDYHGDIIVWPIKIMADYINMSGDVAILDEKIEFWSMEKGAFTDEKYTILDHLEREIKYIEDNYIEGTHISSYGHGDWDDTLQPANKKLRDYMASGWTVPLTYQAFYAYSKALKTYDSAKSDEILVKADAIKADFKKYMIKDDVVTGFAYMENLDEIKYMLHPRDEDTNIKYRLLPINRSIISGLFDEDEVNNHLPIIEEHLKCPDGVRLMDNPAPYNGGTMTYFQRGESASSVGREISLQYVHAHIRYIESMLKLGHADDAYKGLLCINPFNIQKHVPNAAKRQANAYFSSSEGDFNNRYEYAENFGLLKTGDIKVKGGWRIYSSGPGIYLNQLVGNFLGLKYVGGNLVVDPIVPEELVGLNIKWTNNGHAFDMVINSADNKVSLNGENVENYVDEKYRRGGCILPSDKIGVSNKIVIG